MDAEVEEGRRGEGEVEVETTGAAVEGRFERTLIPLNEAELDRRDFNPPFGAGASPPAPPEGVTRPNPSPVPLDGAGGAEDSPVVGLAVAGRPFSVRARERNPRTPEEGFGAAAAPEEEDDDEAGGGAEE